MTRICANGSVFFFHFLPLPWVTEVSFPFLLSLVSTARREGAHRDSLPRTSNNVCLGELYQTVGTGFSIPWRTDLWSRSKIS